MRKKLIALSLASLGLGIILFVVGLLLGGLESYKFLPF